MATKPRKRSNSNFYHVFQRGVNHFDIFEDNFDRDFYLNRLQRYARELGVEIHAWCLMSNHVHLLLHAKLETLSAFMRKLGSVYARYFNLKHSRSGPLFGGRFGSVCVETNAQFLAVVRYIHRNPSYHDDEALFGSYRWSSYNEYIAERPALCKLDLVFSLLGSVRRLVAFHEKDLPSDLERHLDIATIGLMQDDEARLRANQTLHRYGIKTDVSHIGTLPKDTRSTAIALLKKITGCSLRQIQRLTAITYSSIKKALIGYGNDALDRQSPALSPLVTECLSDKN